jgi:hypothetical protein
MHCDSNNRLCKRNVSMCTHLLVFKLIIWHHLINNLLRQLVVNYYVHSGSIVEAVADTISDSIV